MTRTKRDELTTRILDCIRYGCRIELLQQMVEELDDCTEPSAEAILSQLGWYSRDSKSMLVLRLNLEELKTILAAQHVMLDRQRACEAHIEQIIATALAEWIELQKHAAETVA